MSYTRIVARGPGAFPIDMLRFLQAWPATDVDTAGIQASNFSGCSVTPITLETASFPPPHILARFESFGWKAELDSPVPRGWDKVEPGPEQMEQRERSNPHPGTDITRAVQQRTELRSNWPFRTNRGG